MDIGRINRFYFYAYTGEKCGCMTYRFTLAGKADRGILAKAVGDVLGRFPFFRLTPAVSAGGDISFSENAERAEVYPLDGKNRALGTEESGGYMFTVRCGENVIEITAFHGLGDGRAIYSFASSVVCRYFTLKGKEFDTEGLVPDLNSPVAADETETLYEKCLQYRDGLSPDRYKKKDVFRIPADNPLTGTPESHFYRLEYPFDSFSELVKSMNGSPVAFMSALIGKSIASLYDTGDKIITASVPADLRNMLGSRSQSNFTVNADLPIFGGEAELPFRELMLKQKEFLKSQINRDNLVSAVIAYGDLIEGVMKTSLADRENVEKLQSMTIDVAGKQKTYLLTSVGMFRLPSALRTAVTGIHIIPPLIEDPPMACLTAYGNTGCVNWVQNNDDPVLIARIAEKLKEQGIEGKLIDDGRKSADKVEPFMYVR